MDEPALTAINMRLRDDYTADCQRGLERWNKIIERTGVEYKLELPHVAEPPRGWFATANQNNLPTGYPAAVGFQWTDPFRFSRVEEVLGKTAA